MEKEIRITGRYTGLSGREYDYMVTTQGNTLISERPARTIDGKLSIFTEDIPGLFAEINEAIEELAK